MTAPLLYPAIDIRDGQVVRLRQGDYGRETVYGDDAAAVATGFADEGAKWIHVVDLDAARTGEARNRTVVESIVAAVAGRAAVQVGGGVRRVDDARALVDAGVARVVMGSAAIARPSLVDDVSAVVPVAVGLDHRAGRLAVHGWTEESTMTVAQALERFASAAAFVITAIERDGELGGPDVDGIAEAVILTDVPVIASGGVGGLDDVRALGAIDGLHGVITGRALYAGRLRVRDAIRALGEAAAR